MGSVGMNINLINKCNNSSTFCYQNKNRATKLMTTNDVAKVLKWANLKKGSTVGIIGGEPTLNPY